MRRLLLLSAALLLAASCAQQGPIKTKVPARAAGQENVLGLRAEPMETVRIGVVGVGMRGSFAVLRLSLVPGAVITSICDLIPERVDASMNRLRNMGVHQDIATYSGEEDSWKALCEREDVDLVYITTDWLHHAPIALYAMDHGKHVAIEVPAAMDMDEIWALVDKAEQTRLHCMMLENCIYDFFELSTLSLAQNGVFGEIIHAEGAYEHNLDPFWGEYWNNWRLEYNQTHRGDVYPTHGIGPICQALNIHRGDRMKTLVAVDTKAFNGPKIMANHTGKPCSEFANGDQTCTLITTENGKTMLIEHDVMTPRPYSRMYQLVGTDGYAGKYPVEQYCLLTFIFEIRGRTLKLLIQVGNQYPMRMLSRLLLQVSEHTPLPVRPTNKVTSTYRYLGKIADWGKARSRRRDLFRHQWIRRDCCGIGHPESERPGKGQRMVRSNMKWSC